MLIDNVRLFDADADRFLENQAVTTKDGIITADGTSAACLDAGDMVCPGSAWCVDDYASCFDAYPCGLSEGFVCASAYDDILNKLNQKSTRTLSSWISRG